MSTITGPFLDAKKKKGRQPKPWYLRYSAPKTREDGSLVLSPKGRPVLQRHRPFYATKADAEADKPRLAAQFAKTGSGDFLFDRRAAEDYDAAKRLVGDVSLLEVARFWRLHHPEKKTETLADWAPRFFEAIQNRVGDTRHPRDLKSRVGIFLRAGFGARLPATVSRKEVLDYLLKRVPPPKGQDKVSPRTRGNHKAAIHNFFAWLLEEAEVILSNPVDGITERQLPKVVRKEVQFLKLDEFERYLRICERYAPELVAHEILQLISGVRADDEMADFRAEFVHPQTKEIVIPAEVAKTDVREVITQVEDSFWIWWEAYGPKEGLLRPKNYMRRWSRVRFLATLGEAKAAEYARMPLKKLFALPELKAAVKMWPWNGRRRSFCTFHVAKYQSADRTALILRHRGSASTLHKSYRGLGVTQEEGRRYFEIRPQGRLNPVGADTATPAPWPA
jgi:integrase